MMQTTGLTPDTMPADAILLVDDDLRLVCALQRRLQKNYVVEIATSATEAFDAVAERTFAIVISDLNMPGINGIECLRRVKFLSPYTVGILLTGQADLESAISAVNEGHVFRFLRKPCSPDVLRTTLDSALAQYSLMCAEKDILRKTLVGTVATVIKAFGESAPEAFGRSIHVLGIVQKIARELKLVDTWELEMAALLRQIGYTGIPAGVLRRSYSGQTLTSDECLRIREAAGIGQRLIDEIPRLHRVSEIVRRQHEPFQTQLGMVGEDLKLAISAHILRVAVDFDGMLNSGISAEQCLVRLQSAEAEYNSHVLDALSRIVGVHSRAERVA